MKTSLIASIFLIIGCAVGSFPQFPDQVKDHYYVDVHGEEVPKVVLSAIVNVSEIPEMLEAQTVRCLHFEIIQKIPYKIKFIKEEPIKACNGVGGYLPKDMQSILNWTEDVYSWSEDRKHCFKK